ncbi:MAG: bifunctional 4-hydroxy-2-oxoglutarate aldolase/2-dehydro-3-deoxy-phosphogluconate aldolase [Lawsonibacter sp.]
MSNMLNSLLDVGFVAIARGVPEEKIADVAQALYAGGVRFFEVTYDQRREDAQALLARCLKSIYDRLGKKLTIGAGTVMSADQVKAAYDAGATYIVSPNTDLSVVETTKQLGMLSCPGALTPTEVAFAHSIGGDIVKLFPAGSLGFGYIKNLRGPLNYIPLMATGGVSPDNIQDFFAAGIQAVGTCPTVMPPQDIAGERYDHITHLARLHVEAVQKARS